MHFLWHCWWRGCSSWGWMMDECIWHEIACWRLGPYFQSCHSIQRAFALWKSECKEIRIGSWGNYDRWWYMVKDLKVRSSWCLSMRIKCGGRGWQVRKSNTSAFWDGGLTPSHPVASGLSSTIEVETKELLGAGRGPDPTQALLTGQNEEQRESQDRPRGSFSPAIAVPGSLCVLEQ